MLQAGIDKINISVDGMTEETYARFTGFKFDFKKFVENVKWVYANKGNCEIVVKIPGELITEAQRQEFFDTFGDHCDRIFVENFAPCWPEFDIEQHTGVKITKGIYQQDVGDTDTCPYIFYGYSVNADGLVSSCFLDWGRKLVIGDVRQQSMKEIWNSDLMNALRLQHLEGRRRQNGVCGNCGQLSHCLPDNIDAHRPVAAGQVQDAGADQPGCCGTGRDQSPGHRCRGQNEDPPRHAASRRRRRQGPRGDRARLCPGKSSSTFVLLEAAARPPLRRRDRGEWHAQSLSPAVSTTSPTSRPAPISCSSNSGITRDCSNAWRAHHFRRCAACSGRMFRDCSGR